MSIQNYFPTNENPTQGIYSLNDETQPVEAALAGRLQTFNRSGEYRIVQVWPKYAMARAAENIMEWFARNLFGWQVPCFRKYKIVPVSTGGNHRTPNHNEVALSQRLTQTVARAKESFDATIAIREAAQGVGAMPYPDAQKAQEIIDSSHEFSAITIDQLARKQSGLSSWSELKRFMDQVDRGHSLVTEGATSEDPITLSAVRFIQSLESNLSVGGRSDLIDFYWSYDNFVRFERSCPSSSDASVEERLQTYRDKAEDFAKFKYRRGKSNTAIAFGAWLQAGAPRR